MTDVARVSESIKILKAEGTDVATTNFFTLSASVVIRIAELGKWCGYRKSKNAPGSYGRMFYEYMKRHQNKLNGSVCNE